MRISTHQLFKSTPTFGHLGHGMDWHLSSQPRLGTLDTAWTDTYHHNHVWAPWTRHGLTPIITTTFGHLGHGMDWHLSSQPRLGTLDTAWTDTYHHNHVWAPWTRQGLTPIITSGRKKHEVGEKCLLWPLQLTLRHFWWKNHPLTFN